MEQLMATANDPAGPGRQPITDRQRELYNLIEKVCDLTGEPPTERFLARRIGVHHSTVQWHLHALHRKGWLRTPTPWIAR